MVTFGTGLGYFWYWPMVTFGTGLWLPLVLVYSYLLHRLARGY